MRKVFFFAAWLFFFAGIHNAFADSYHCLGCNIVLISVDTLRPDHTALRHYFRNTTPNLAELGKESVFFETVYSAAPWTVPAHMSIFTGLYPSVHGVVNKYAVTSSDKFVPAKLSSSVRTLPELLKSHGYTMAAFTGDAGVSAQFGFGRGFDVYENNTRFAGFANSIPQALRWTKKNNGRKFFLFVHGYDVHGQYDPPEGYRREFCRNYHGKLKGGKIEQGELREEALSYFKKKEKAWLPGITSADAEFYKSLYDEKVQDMDRHIGYFISSLRQLGLFDKTILVIVSDHGDEFFEHGAIDHGHTLYEELERVFFMIHFPGLGHGKDFKDVVTTMDAFPTVLDAVGISFNSGSLDGKSLIPVLTGKEQTVGPVFFETDYREFTHKRGVRFEHYVFVLTLESGKKEMYDLATDPGEKQNIVESQPRIAYEMEQRLLKHLQQMNTQQDIFYYKTHTLPVIRTY